MSYNVCMTEKFCSETPRNIFLPSLEKGTKEKEKK
jgi:hypothetical protein